MSFVYSDTYVHDKRFKSAPPHEQMILEALDEMLLKVQYARTGNKSEMRREIAHQILDTVKKSYRNYRSQQ